MRKEKAIIPLLFLCAATSIIVTFFILGFLLLESFPIFAKYGLTLISGMEWKPYDDPPKFGLLPTIIGTLAVSGICLLISVPVGILAAIYLAEYSGSARREIIEVSTQLLVGVPSVILGFLGLVVLVPAIRSMFGGWGFSVLAGGIILSIMTLPHIILISGDAIKSVPREYRLASLALGASKWQTITKVVLPSARSGILASVILGLCNAIGETMAVFMVIGNPEVPFIPESILDRVRVLTSTIVIEFNYAVWGSEQMKALFAIGVILFLIASAHTLAAKVLLRRGLHAKI